jgi:hypothetical protein
MVDPVIIPEVEANGSAIVGLHRHGLRADMFDGSQRAVLYAEPALVLQEHDAIPAGEAALAALDREAHLIPQITRSPHPLPRGLIEGAHLVVGVCEDDPAAPRR